eukprot:CAMPEP_0197705098 /NCGR_PEP_ID=MMETSP1338-20131121/126270_1 /TAXON_ID=43686 ORGANISM="Pelagodinium beii, Strain RCC1491" /NCGR_SAMPLE_ID=MMETSP1338 /ASSEMBLY_ACC=CAM_ASM_000754 /LENGTH=138 /DNA_ID=CAMNT_0043289003 /DNA_START=3013 /DNA_END=3430 /DNA_ORIENTATION=+
MSSLQVARIVAKTKRLAAAHLHQPGQSLSPRLLPEAAASSPSHLTHHTARAYMHLALDLMALLAANHQHLTWSACRAGFGNCPEVTARRGCQAGQWPGPGSKSKLLQTGVLCGFKEAASTDAQKRWAMLVARSCEAPR